MALSITIHDDHDKWDEVMALLFGAEAPEAVEDDDDEEAEEEEAPADKKKRIAAEKKAAAAAKKKAAEEAAAEEEDDDDDEEADDEEEDDEADDEEADDEEADDEKADDEDDGDDAEVELKRTKLRAKLKKAIADGKRDGVKSLIKKHGGTTMSNIPDDKLDDALKAAIKLLK